MMSSFELVRLKNGTDMFCEVSGEYQDESENGLVIREPLILMSDNMTNMVFLIRYLVHVDENHELGYKFPSESIEMRFMLKDIVKEWYLKSVEFNKKINGSSGIDNQILKYISDMDAVLEAKKGVEIPDLQDILKKSIH